MKVLVIGSGGREHSLGLALKKSPKVGQIVFAPGNPGMETLGICEKVSAEDVSGLCALAQKIAPDLVVVGPEVPLVLGLTDELKKMGIAVFGPSKAAARLEGSKAFSKDFMSKYKIPTADYQNFTDLDSALQYLATQKVPIVIKASGLAAGKGAIVCMSRDEAIQAVTSMLGNEKMFGDAGAEVVIEEFMQGEEASIFAVCDGKNYVVLAPAQDHKRIFDNDEGPNTGGMGAYAPAPIVTAELMEQVKKTVIEPSLAGMIAEECPYTGTLFIGLMIHNGIARVVEYNCRFGDPETQVVLPLYTEDLFDLLYNAAKGTINLLPIHTGENKLNLKSKSAAVVVLASRGYPASSSKGQVIWGLDAAAKLDNVQVVHAGTRKNNDSIETAGGRVLGVVGEGENLELALKNAYTGVKEIKFDGMQYRKDIGAKGLKHFNTISSK